MSVNIYKQYEDGHVDFKIIADDEDILEGYSSIVSPLKVAEPITFISGILPVDCTELFSGLTFRPLDNHVDFSTADWSQVEDATRMFKGTVFDILNGKDVYLDFESADLSKLSTATSMFESIENVDALLFGDYFVTRGIEDKLPLAEVSRMFYDFKGVIKINDDEGWMNRISAQEDRFARNIFGEGTYISEAITRETKFHPAGKYNGKFSYEYIADPIVVYKVDDEKRTVEFRNITETPELDYLIENDGYKAWNFESYKDYSGDYTVLTYNHGRVYLPTNATNFFRGVKYSGDSDLPYFDFSYVENATSMFEDAGFSYKYHLDYEEGIFDLSRVPSFRNVKNATRMFYNFDADVVRLPRMFENNADLIVDEFCNLSSKDGVKFGRVNGEELGTQFIVRDNTGEAAINEYVSTEFNSTVFTTIMRHLSGKSDSLTIVEARLPWEIRELKSLGYKPCTEEFYNTPCYSADDPAYYPVNYFTTTPEDVLVVDYYKAPSFEDVSWMFAGISFTTDCAAQITSTVDFYNAKNVAYAFREATIAQSDYASTIKFKFKTDLHKPGIDWVDASGMFLGCNVGAIIFDEYFTKKFMNKPIMDYMFYQCDADIVCPEYVGWEASSATKMFDDSGKDIKLAVVGERFIPKYIPSKYGFFMYKTGTTTLYIAEITDAADYEKYDNLGYTLWTPVSYLHYKRYKIDDIVCNECPDIWIFPEDSSSFFRACTLTENFLKKFTSRAIFGDYIYSGAKAEEYAKLFKSASYGLDGTLSFRRKLKIMDSMFEHTVFEGGKFTFPLHTNTKFIESAFSLFFKAELDEVNFDSTKWNHDGLIRLTNMERMFYDHKFIINCNDFSGWDNPKVTGRNSKDMFGDDLDAFYAVVGGDDQENPEFFNGHFNTKAVGLYWTTIKYKPNSTDADVYSRIFVLRNDDDTQALIDDYSDPALSEYFEGGFIVEHELKPWTSDSYKEYSTLETNSYAKDWVEAKTGPSGFYSAFDFGDYTDPKIKLPGNSMNLFRGILFDSYGLPEGQYESKFDKGEPCGYNIEGSADAKFTFKPPKICEVEKTVVKFPLFIRRFYTLRDGKEVKGWTCKSFPYMNPSWAYDIIARQLDFSHVNVAVNMFKDFGSSIGSYECEKEGMRPNTRETAMMLAGCHIGQLDLSGINLSHVKHADCMFEDLKVGELIMKKIKLPGVKRQFTANGMFRSSVRTTRQTHKQENSSSKNGYSYGIGTDILNIILTIEDGTQLRDHVIDNVANTYDNNTRGMFGTSNFDDNWDYDWDRVDGEAVYTQVLPWKNADPYVKWGEYKKHKWAFAENGAIDDSVDPENGNFRRYDNQIYIKEHNVKWAFNADQIYGEFTISNKDGDYLWRGSWNPNMCISNRFQYNEGMHYTSSELKKLSEDAEDCKKYPRPHYYSLKLVDNGETINFPSNCYGLFAQYNSMRYDYYDYKDGDYTIDLNTTKNTSGKSNVLTQGLTGIYLNYKGYDEEIKPQVAKHAWPKAIYERADLSNVKHADFMFSSFAVGYNYFLDYLEPDLAFVQSNRREYDWMYEDKINYFLLCEPLNRGLTKAQKDSRTNFKTSWNWPAPYPGNVDYHNTIDSVTATYDTGVIDCCLEEKPTSWRDYEKGSFLSIPDISIKVTSPTTAMMSRSSMEDDVVRKKWGPSNWNSIVDDGGATPIIYSFVDDLYIKNTSQPYPVPIIEKYLEPLIPDFEFWFDVYTKNLKTPSVYYKKGSSTCPIMTYRYGFVESPFYSAMYATWNKAGYHDDHDIKKGIWYYYKFSDEIYRRTTPDVDITNVWDDNIKYYVAYQAGGVNSKDIKFKFLPDALYANTFGFDHLYGHSVLSRIFDDLPTVKLENAQSISGLIYQTKTLNFVNNLFKHPPYFGVTSSFGTFKEMKYLRNTLLSDSFKKQIGQLWTDKGNRDINLTRWMLNKEAYSKFNAKGLNPEKINEAAICFVNQGIDAVDVSKYYDWSTYKNIRSCFAMFYDNNGRFCKKYNQKYPSFEPCARPYGTDLSNIVINLFGKDPRCVPFTSTSKEILDKDTWNGRHYYLYSNTCDYKDPVLWGYEAKLAYPIIDRYNAYAKIAPFDHKHEIFFYLDMVNNCIPVSGRDQARIKTAPVYYYRDSEDNLINTVTSEMADDLKDVLGFFTYEDDYKLYHDRLDYGANGRLHFSNDPAAFKNPSMPFTPVYESYNDPQTDPQWLFWELVKDVVWDKGTVLPRCLTGLFLGATFEGCSPFPDPSEIDTSNVRVADCLFYGADLTDMPSTKYNLPMMPFKELVGVAYMYADCQLNLRDSDMFRIREFRRGLDYRDRYDNILLNDCITLKVPDDPTWKDYKTEMIQCCQARYMLARIKTKAIDFAGMIANKPFRNNDEIKKDKFGNYKLKLVPGDTDILPPDYHEAHKINGKAMIKGITFKNKKTTILYPDYDNMNMRFDIDEFWKDTGMDAELTIDDGTAVTSQAKKAFQYYSDGGYFYEPTEYNHGQSSVSYKIPEWQGGWSDDDNTWTTTDIFFKKDDRWYKADIYTKVNGEWKLSKS